jgi:hypothetical protein
MSSEDGLAIQVIGVRLGTTDMIGGLRVGMADGIEQ